MSFCCKGCRQVYLLLHQSQLGNYYTIERQPGLPRGEKSKASFDFLDEEDVTRRMCTELSGDRRLVVLRLPGIHCSSCVWLLEHLYRLEPAVERCTVNFLRKEAELVYDHKALPLSRLAQLLHDIGYEADFRMQDLGDKKISSHRHRDWIHLGITAFCFGNVMLLSFPEYVTEDLPIQFSLFFSYAASLLSFPPLFIACQRWFKTSLVGLSKKMINMDVPISLGMLTLFARSAYESWYLGNPGYWDSLCAFIFFLLLGRSFQEKTFDSIHFDRDYRAYFPMSVLLKNQDGQWTSTAVHNLKGGEEIELHHGDVLAADSILLDFSATFDNSFLTGESLPLEAVPGQELPAGSRLASPKACLRVLRPTQEGSLARAWARSSNRDRMSKSDVITSRISPVFTLAIVSTAIVTLLTWVVIGQTGTGILALSSVLIVACPCALALAAPLVHGSSLRLLSRRGIHVRDGASLERMAEIDTIIFDKTGTLTTGLVQLNPIFSQISSEQQDMIHSVCRLSSHPVAKALALQVIGAEVSVNRFQEQVGLGIEAQCADSLIRIGSAAYLDLQKMIQLDASVGISINGELIAAYHRRNEFRPEWLKTLQSMPAGLDFHLLSGDRDWEQDLLLRFFKSDQIHFNQSPEAKQLYLEKLQNDHKKVCMIGDGLNDAAALQSAYMGIAIHNEQAHFSPACDLIIPGADFADLPFLFKSASMLTHLIWFGFAISIMYNLIGVVIAASALLSPLYAAILMPLSSLTIVSLSTMGCSWILRKNKLTPKSAF